MDALFSLTSDAGSRRPYAPSIIGDNKLLFRSCPHCKGENFNFACEDVKLLVEGKGKLPDFLLCGRWPLLIVSARVLEAWQVEKITGYIPHPVILVDKQLTDISPNMNYYNIEVIAKAKLDLHAMGLRIAQKCPKCGRAISFNKETWEYGKAILKETSYDGSDLFVCEHFAYAVNCTKKVLEVAHKRKLTNAVFGFFEDSFDSINTENIDLKAMFSKQSD